LVNNQYKKKYENKKKVCEGKETQQKSIDDLCPICLDDLENGDEIDFCKYSCGKSVHSECFEMWAKSKGPNCVFCRESWLKVNDSTTYINLLN
jgi:hypothetical protein